MCWPKESKKVLQSKLALAVRVCFVFDPVLNLGKETMESFGRSNATLEDAPLAKGNNVLWGILETNTVGGAMRAQQFHAGCC